MQSPLNRPAFKMHEIDQLQRESFHAAHAVSRAVNHGPVFRMEEEASIASTLMIDPSCKGYTQARAHSAHKYTLGMHAGRERGVDDKVKGQGQPLSG